MGDRTSVSVQIGNSDDKLSQREWHQYVESVKVAIGASATCVHFFASSEGSQSWQNACWVFEIRKEGCATLMMALAELRKHFKQDSVAWTEGDTIFV